MSRSPMDILMGRVDFRAVKVEDDVLFRDDLPYVTHEGKLEIDGFVFRCYRLSSGDAVFEAEDIERWFSGMGCQP